MPSALYSVYRSKVFALAKTIVVKSSIIADAINRSLTERFIEVQTSFPETWKYYKNLAGEYHFTDTMMTVTSLDTLEVIDFTKANLAVHRVTAKEYQYGSRYYQDLVNKFPEQESIIFGILYPVDIIKAIEADDNTILYYDPLLVEENEYNLIPELQVWIKRFMERWLVKGYLITDDLYAACLYGTLFALMPIEIMNIRLKNCKTNLVHSYHILEYLASNGKIDKYVDILTKKQQLFLYRNLRYLHHHAGKQQNFELLVDRILTDRGFPLVSYEMRHNTELMPGSLTPTVELVQEALNLQHIEGRSDVVTVGEMLSKEVGQARDNFKTNPDFEVSINAAAKVTKYNNFKTKILESIVLDTTDDGPFRQIDTLINHWIYLSDLGLYRAFVSFTNPTTGDKVQLSAKDAFFTYLYCLNKSYGVTLDTIPTIEAIRVRRLPVPTLSELKSIVENRLVSDATLQTLLSGLTTIGSIISTETFYSTITAVHERLRLHRLQYSAIEHNLEQGMVKAAAFHLYGNYKVSLSSDNINYADWLDNLGLNFDNFSQEDFESVYVDLTVSATGQNESSVKTLREIQEGSLRLMAQLSSYSVQYIPTINTEPYTAVDWPIVRIGDINSRGNNKVTKGIVKIDIEAINCKNYNKDIYSIGLAGTDLSADTKILTSAELDIGLNVSTMNRPIFHGHLNLNNIAITGMTIGGLYLPDIIHDVTLDDFGNPDL